MLSPSLPFSDVLCSFCMLTPDLLFIPFYSFLFPLICVSFFYHFILVSRLRLPYFFLLTFLSFLSFSKLLFSHLSSTFIYISQNSSFSSLSWYFFNPFFNDLYLTHSFFLFLATFSLFLSLVHLFFSYLFLALLLLLLLFRSDFYSLVFFSSLTFDIVALLFISIYSMGQYYFVPSWFLFLPCHLQFVAFLYIAPFQLHYLT